MSKVYTEEFKEIIKDISENPNVLELRNYIQHVNSSRYDHCIEVAFLTYVVCKKMNIEYVSATRGAFLHDFYFYDYKNKEKSPKHFHLYKHPRISLTNALNIFDLNDLERDVILNHMWPITIRFPMFLETYIVTFIDKYCATVEFFKSVMKNIKKFEEINSN